jgi:hypothetical protein
MVAFRGSSSIFSVTFIALSAATALCRQFWKGSLSSLSGHSDTWMRVLNSDRRSRCITLSLRSHHFSRKLKGKGKVVPVL